MLILKKVRQACVAPLGPFPIDKRTVSSHSTAFFLLNNYDVNE